MKKEEERKTAQEQSCFEYLSEHLKERILDGKHEKDFLIARAHTPALKDFRSFKELLETLQKESMSDVKDETVRQLVQAYQEKWHLRPSIGVVVIAVLWERLRRVAYGEWFDDGVYWLFEEALLANTDEPGIIESLMETIKREKRNKKVSRPIKEDDFE